MTESGIETVRAFAKRREERRKRLLEVRPRVISEETHSDLTELLRFRHLRRYYVQLACDWERIDAIVGRLQRVHAKLEKELDSFESLVKRS